MLSSNQFVQSSYPSQSQQQQNAFKHIGATESKKKSKKQSKEDSTDAKNPNRAFALYNQGNGRIGQLIPSLKEK